MKAAERGYLDLVRQLIGAGADVKLEDQVCVYHACAVNQ